MFSESDLKYWKGKMAAGRLAYDAGFFMKAASHFRTALKLVEDKDLPEELLCRSLVDLAKTLGSIGQFEEAEEMLSRALQLDQKDNASQVELIEDFHQLSLLYWRARKQESAMQALNRASELFSKHEQEVPDELKAKLLKHKAVLLAEHGDYTQAKKIIDEAIDFIGSSHDLGKFSSIYGDSLVVNLTVLVELGRYEEARALYPDAIKVLDLSRGEMHVKTISMLEALVQLARSKGLDKDAHVIEKELKRIKEMIQKKAVY